MEVAESENMSLSVTCYNAFTLCNFALCTIGQEHMYCMKQGMGVCVWEMVSMLKIIIFIYLYFSSFFILLYLFIRHAFDYCKQIPHYC